MSIPTTKIQLSVSFEVIKKQKSINNKFKIPKISNAKGQKKNQNHENGCKQRRNIQKCPLDSKAFLSKKKAFEKCKNSLNEQAAKYKDEKYAF